MIWGAMSSAGVGPLCFLKTNVIAPVYQEMLEHFKKINALFHDILIYWDAPVVNNINTKATFFASSNHAKII